MTTVGSGLRRVLATLAVGVLAAGVADGGTAVPTVVVGEVEPMAADTPAFLARLGVHVTAGAAPGYVADRLCADCHGAIAASFAEVAMSRAFVRPLAARRIERFGETFVHAASGRRYRLEWRGERLVFRRWRVDAAGREADPLELDVEWVLGSGNHARTYLYGTPSGELWQLPLAWYAEGGGTWGMAPGYDRPDHEDVGRLVQRECLACHTAYPEVAAGADRPGAAHRFPAGLPEGIGCQRCHGPGAEHVRRTRDPAVPVERFAAAILAPQRLPPDRRADVCRQCHLQPAVALPALLRDGRGDFGYRPGESLAAHRVELDATLEGRPAVDRFEINHHAYRLEASRCFVASEGRLGCLTCHDPHRKVPAAGRTAHYRAACVGCHAQDACPDERRRHAAAPDAPSRDCTECHMPPRRPDDVVHVTVTDHRIAIPSGGDLMAPRSEWDPVLVDAAVYRSPGRLEADAATDGVADEIYRALGVVRASGDTAIPFLERRLAALATAVPDLWLRLASGQLYARRFAAAEASLDRVPDARQRALPRAWRGLAAAGQGRGEEAVAALVAAVALDPELPELQFDLGRLLQVRGDPVTAQPHLERAVVLRPTFAAAWLRLGEVHETRGDPYAAIAAYRSALAVEPATAAARVALARTLRANGDVAAAAEVEAQWPDARPAVTPSSVGDTPSGGEVP